jgi:hypothetical protein
MKNDYVCQSNTAPGYKWRCRGVLLSREAPLGNNQKKELNADSTCGTDIFNQVKNQPETKNDQ